jgi:hypothetical protein
MARPLRIQYPGAVYHITSRGNERKVIYKSQRDREKFIEYLQSATGAMEQPFIAFAFWTITIICSWKRPKAIYLQ